MTRTGLQAKINLNSYKLDLRNISIHRIDFNIKI